MATYKVRVDGKEHDVTVVENVTGGATVTVGDREFEVELVGTAGSAARPRASAARSASEAPVAVASAAPAAAPSDGASVMAPIPGKIIAIHVKQGDTVEAGQVILILEAMKMENNIAAPRAGTVKEIAVTEGAEVADGQLLIAIE